MKKLSLLIVSLVLTAIPLLLPPTVAYADGCEVIDQSLVTYGTSIPSFPRYCSIGEITRKILNVAFTLIGGVSLLFVIIGGYQYMTARDNQEQAATGKKTVIYAVIGLAVVIMAVPIVNIVANLLLYRHAF